MAGTGRAGTTFLVRYLTAIGLDTHLSRRSGNASIDHEAQAGLEDFPTGTAIDDMPYVIKNPMLHEFIDQLLSNADIEIDAVIIPVRNLREAVSSRVILERRAMYGSQPWLGYMDRAWDSGANVPGGLVYSLNALDQARILAVGFHFLVEQLVHADVPIVFIDFPRMINDAGYLFRKTAPFHPVGTSEATALAAHAELAQPTLVRTERELTSAAFAENDRLNEELDRAALRRELVRLREQLRAGSQPNDEAMPQRLELLPVSVLLAGKAPAKDGQIRIVIDDIATLRDPAAFDGETLRAKNGDEIYLRGWAVDMETLTGLTGVAGIFDDRQCVLAVHGLTRDDVAAALAEPATRQCGFTLRMPTRNLGAGPHTIDIAFLSADGATYLTHHVAKLELTDQ